MTTRQEQIDRIYHTLDEFGLGALADEIATHLVDSGCRFADGFEIVDQYEENDLHRHIIKPIDYKE